jgi:hypothetical protein
MDPSALGPGLSKEAALPGIGHSFDRPVLFLDIIFSIKANKNLSLRVAKKFRIRQNSTLIVDSNDR